VSAIPSYWGDGAECMSWQFSSEESADERRVLATRFPEKTSRPPWQTALGDLVSKLEELRSAVEGVVLAVLPFLHGSDVGETEWSSDELADPLPVELSTDPE